MDRLQMNQKMPWSARFLSIFLSGLMLATPFSVVAQLPTNPGVVHGDVNFNQQGLDLFINQSTGSAIVNWDSFSIGSGNGVHITQPGSKSAMLSRVLGEDPSVIQGLLEATGIVYLVNQNGIYFGPDSRIDAGAIVASTMDMDNDAFMAGRALFRGTAEADIINEGDITAEQFVAFLARNVRNSGHIRANAVTMAAVENVTFDTIYGGWLSVDVTGMVGDVENAGYIEITPDIEGVIQGALFAGRDVENEGTITADGNSSGGYIGFVADQDVTIGEGGTISAGRATVSLTGGSVMMEPDAYISGGSVLAEATAGDAIVYGDIDVSSDDGQGGSVQVLGQRVGLLGNASIDASGATGGGTVNVGGNFQGKGDLQNAVRTFVGSDVVINVDAVDSGDGGTAIVWADGSTGFTGTITGRGAGFAEVSGKETLAFNGHVDLRGHNGELGTLLLDPEDILVTAGGNPDLDGDLEDDANT
ncbi:MAG: filamentous hemagglutinin N-terminal domain-containing protein, partial [Lentisphaeria bacterium]|nr:filamentous hemagglutinin N-terminal domain-containing protein [Lentisphaeria bacterium]